MLIIANTVLMLRVISVNTKSDTEAFNTSKLKAVYLLFTAMDDMYTRTGWTTSVYGDNYTIVGILHKLITAHGNANCR